MRGSERNRERQRDRQRETERDRGEGGREEERELWHIKSQAWYTHHPREKPCLSDRR